MPDDFRKTLRERALARLEPIPEEEPSFSVPVPIAPGITAPIPKEVVDIVNPAVEAAMEAVESTFFQIGKGVSQLEDNPIAGAANLAGGLLKVPMLLGIAPFSAIDAGLRASGKTGEDVADVINVPFEFLHKLPKELAEGESVFSVGRAVESSGLGDFVRDNIALRIDPGKAEEMKEAINDVTGLLTTVTALKAAHKGGVAAKSKIGDILKKTIKIDESTVQGVPETKPLLLEAPKGEVPFEIDPQGRAKSVLTEKQTVRLEKLRGEKSKLNEQQADLTTELKNVRNANKKLRKELPKSKDRKGVGQEIKANNKKIGELKDEIKLLDENVSNVDTQLKGLEKFESAQKARPKQKQLVQETPKPKIETENVPSDIDFAVPKSPTGQIKGTPVLVYNPKSGKFKLAKKGKQPEGLTEEKVLPVKTDDYVAFQTDKGVRFKDPKSGKMISKEKAVKESTKQAEKPQTIEGDLNAISGKDVFKLTEDMPTPVAVKGAQKILGDKFESEFAKFKEKNKPITGMDLTLEQGRILEDFARRTVAADKLGKKTKAEVKPKPPKVEKPKAEAPKVSETSFEKLEAERTQREQAGLEKVDLEKRSLLGYEKGKTELELGRIAKVLNKEVRFEGELIKKKDLLSSLVEKGFELNENKKILREKGKIAGLKVNATESKFVEFLQSKTKVKGKRFISEETHKKDIDIIKDDISKQPSKFLPFSSPKVQMAYTRAGAYHLENVVRSGVKKAQQFKEWSKPMIQDFGQKIKPYLLKIWAEIKKEFGKKLIEFAEKNPFTKPLGVVEGGFSDALRGSKIPKEEFVKNRANLAKREKLTSRAKESIDKEIQSIKKGISKRAKPLDTRLYEINPKIYQAVKKNDFNTNIRTIRDEAKISRLTEPAKKLPKGVHKDIDLVLKNNERSVARGIFKEHGLEKQFDGVIETIEKVSSELGVEKNIPGWFPRMVRDYEGLMKEFYKKLDAKLNTGEVKKVKNFLEQLKLDKQKKLGRDLTIEEEATLYNNALRGYNPGIKLSKIANEKARVIDVLDADLNKYYHRWDAAVTAYVGQAREAIGARTLFGKKKGKEVDFTEKSVGRLIAEQMLDEPLSPKQIFEVKEILKSAFQPRKAEVWVSTIKDVGYLTRLFNWVSSLTQLGDNYVPLYRSPRQFIKTFPKAVGGQIPGIKKWIKSDIPLRKLGIDVDRFARELVDPKQRGKVMRHASVASLFKSIDIVGKETLVNTLYQKYHKAAKAGKLVKGHPDYWRFERRFGKNADAVIREFATRKPGELTGRMAFQLFDELDATQPYSRWATPEAFHTTGALGQLAYQFKTFTLRRIDFVLNETLRRVRDPKTSKKDRIRAGKNLVKLLIIITLVDGSVDVAKKLLRGQKIELSDIAIDNLLGLFMLSKYDVTTARREGLGSAIASKIAPVTGAVDDIYMDMISLFGDKDFKFRTIRNLPVLGEVVYNWINKATKRKVTHR